MKISAVVTCYESINTIGLCVFSLAGQSLKPDEIIVTDDGSSPPTCRLVNNLLETVEQSFGIPVQFITHERTSPYRLNTIRNSGIERASGDLILLLDGDILLPADILHSHAEIHSQMQKRGQRAFVFCVRKNMTIDGAIRDSRVSEWGRDLDKFLLKKQWNELDLEPEHALSQATFLREDWEKVGKFDPDFDGHWGYDEVEFAFRLKSMGTILTSDGIIYHLDQGPGAGSRDGTRNHELYEQKKNAWERQSR